jgi:REP element-mobilizing transposase RayT
MSDDILFKNRYRIPSARLRCWDYRWAGVYSVTICTEGRVCCLGEIVDGQVSLSRIGKVVAQEWRKIPRHHPRVRLDESIVMPNHMHGILAFDGDPREEREHDTKHLLSESLGAVVGHFKSRVTKRAWWNLKEASFAWQPRFFDVIVRDPAALDRARAYIRDNPKRWNPPARPFL